MDTRTLFKKMVNLVTLSSFLLWNLAAATPEGGTVVQGNASISNPTATQTVINQTSQNTVINWQSFNTASNESVRFNQPNASSIALNRITNGAPTNFAGSLSANGQVWILNPAGVLFTNTAKIDVGGLLATTHNITDANFMSGNYRFDLVPGFEAASIINNGSITAADAGIVALVGPNVANNGLIQVNLGKVSLSSGATYVLDMYGDQLINFGSNAPISNGTVSNAGKIIADGGKVYMTANYASGVLDNMINMSGTIQAKSVGVNNKGEIVLFGGNIKTKKVAGVTKVSGKLDASDSTGGSNGGFIETSGEYVYLDPASIINPGLGGTWLLDPNDISIIAGGACTNPACANPYTATGASTVGASFIQGILATGANVTITASGNISIDTPLAIGGPYTVLPPPIQPILTLNAGGDININQTITNASGVSHLYMFLNAGQSIATGSIHINANILMASGFVAGGYLNFTAGPLGFIYVNTPLVSAGSIPLVNGQSAFGFIFNSPVILQQNATFDSVFSHSMFNSTIDNCTGLACVNGPGPFSLTISSQVGLIDFGGDVGVNAPLASITVNNFGMRGTGATQFITTGDQYYNPQVFSFGSNSFTFIGQNPGALVTLNGGAHTNNSGGFVQIGDATYATNALIRSGISGYFPLTSSITVYGTTVLDGATNVTSGTQDYKGAVTITSNNTVLNSGGLVLFENTVDGPGSLTTNASNTQFNSVAAGLSQFSAFNINNTMTLNGGSINQNAVTYNFPVVVTALNGTMNAIGLIDFVSTLTGAGLLTINDPLGNVQFDGPTVNLGALNVTGPTSISTAVMQTTGDQTYNSPVTLANSTVNIKSGASGNVTFNDIITGGPNNLVIDPLTVTFNAPVNVASLWVVATSAININTDSIITTVGEQRYIGPVVLLYGSPITFTSAGHIIFVGSGSTINGAQDLILNPAAPPTNFVELSGSVGNLIPLSSLTVNGWTRFNGVGSVSTSGNQLYAGPVTLNDAVTMTTPSLVTFNGTVDALAAFLPITQSLTVNGDVIFNDTVGAINGLSNLTVNGQTTINTPIVTTWFNQLYNGIVLLNVNTQFTSFSGNITFDNTLNGAVDITFNAPAGGIFFNDIVGGFMPLNSLTVLAGTAVINTSALTTVNNQLYQGPVAVGTDATLTSNAGAITFDSWLDGFTPGNSLIINAFSLVNFNSLVGSVLPLNNLDVTGSTIDIKTSQMSTLGNQTYHNPVVIMADVNSPGFQAGGIITFESTLNGDGLGPWNLTAGAAEVHFKNIVGGVDPLNAFTINANIINFDTNATSITTVGVQSYMGLTTMTIGADPVFMAPSFVVNIPTVLLLDTTFTSTVGDIDFQSTVDGPANLILNPTGSVIFQGDVGAVTPLASLLVNGLSSISGATLIQTDGDQIYADTVTLNNSVTMNTLVDGDIQYNGGGVFDPTTSYTLSASSADSALGPVGHGITGKVNVGGLILSGPGGANLSENYPVSESFVNGQGGQQARTNTVAPPNVSGVVIYCVNGFNCAPVNNLPNNIPSTEIFNIPLVPVCDASGCNNLELMIDNLTEAGVVTCGGMGECAYGFATAEDTNGNTRILAPGSVVYLGDKIMKDEDSCVCVKSLYTEKTMCMGPKDKKQEYKS